MSHLPASTSAVQRVDVALGERSYPILIGADLLRGPGVLDGLVAARDVLLLTNTIVGPLYAERVTAALPGRRIVDVRLPDGEQHKTLENVSRVLDTLVANRFARDSLAIALGGGVVGDLCGFTSACYQRGIAFAQLPTTLLAQVDSSVGGKTGVNHPGGKNLIGAFHQPRFVVADTVDARHAAAARAARGPGRGHQVRPHLRRRRSSRGSSRTWRGC